MRESRGMDLATSAESTVGCFQTLGLVGHCMSVERLGSCQRKRQRYYAILRYFKVGFIPF